MQTSEDSSPAATGLAFVQGRDEILRVPTGQILAQLFVAIPPEQLAALGSSGTAVWSSRPTALELPMPLDAGALIAGLRRDVPVWRDAADKGQGVGPMYRFGLFPSTSSAPPTVLQLVIYATRFGGLSVNLRGFDANAKRLFDLRYNPHDQKLLNLYTNVPPPAAPVESVPIDPTTAKLIRVWSSFVTVKESAAWRNDPALLDAYFNPEKHDPVAASFGRSMLELARARGKQLIASESDNFPFALPTSSVVKGKLNLGGIEASLAKPEDPDNCTIEYAADERWITARPQDYERSSEDNFDRSNLGNLLRVARDKHALGVLDVAHYAAEHDQPFGPLSLRASRLLTGLIPGITGMELLNDGYSWCTYSFLGRLDDAQLAVAQRPEGLNLSNCTPAQLSAVWSALWLGSLSYHGQTDVWQSYRTDGLPHGLPGGGVLHLTETTAPVLYARFGDAGIDAESPQRYTPEQFARRLSPSTSGERYNSYNLLSIQPEVNTGYLFHFNFPDNTTATMRINAYMPTSPAVKSIDELPETLKRGVKAAIAKLGS